LSEFSARAVTRARRAAKQAGYIAEPLNELSFGLARAGQKKKIRDVEPITAILESFLATPSVRQGLLLPKVKENWQRIVGPNLAGNCQPYEITNGILKITASSTAWATEIKLLANVLVNNACDILGANSVTEIQVSGPQYSWRPRGTRTVKGAVGYGDTFG
jgi:predicted nucleic acid-binding Zn ribbon protein